MGMLPSGNFEYDAHPREVERLFDKYGPLERVDMKTGETPCCGNRDMSQSGRHVADPCSAHVAP